ncbi:MAG: alpha/beta fold hydrolase [bacterium]|nr:alpha/beta fold hydrolase [bacterium]
MKEMETVTFDTSDGMKIYGLYYPAANPAAPAALLSHMMPVTKESWKSFAPKLTEAGFQVLAIDLRGHGESVARTTNDGRTTLNFKNFSDEEHQWSIRDLEAAVEFLKLKGASATHLIGASIGANLSFQYFAEHSDTRSVILLSPGLDYRGVKTEECATKLRFGQAVYYVAADDDPYSAQSVKTLYQKTPEGIKKEIKLFERAGHGTNMFLAHPELMEELVLWLKNL